VVSKPTFKSNSNSYSSFYRMLDLLIILMSLVLACTVSGVTITPKYYIAALALSVIYSNIAELLEIYRPWRVGRFSTMIIATMGAFLVSFLILMSIMFVIKYGELFSRMAITLWFIFILSFCFLWRLAIRLYNINRRSLGYNIKQVAVIGATNSGQDLYNEIRNNEELGFEFVGFYDDRSAKRVYETNGLVVKANVNEAIANAKNGLIDILFIALPLKADKRITNILAHLGDTTVDVHFIPDSFISNLMHARVSHVGNLDTISVYESPYLGAKEWLKRSLDVVVGSLILVLISPLLIIISILVKATSKGPVLFKQTRYGLGGHKIIIWKFRSMGVTKVNEGNDATDSTDEKVIQATQNDPRITPLGAFLRRTSLDELPQFFNVVGGGMSIVGPRPHAVAHNEEYRQKIKFYMLRHTVKPGITGWAQINGWRGETDTLEKMEKRIEFDLMYIKNWSILWDIKIIFLTLFKGFMSKNAY